MRLEDTADPVISDGASDGGSGGGGAGGGGPDALDGPAIVARRVGEGLEFDTMGLIIVPCASS